MLIRGSVSAGAQGMLDHVLPGLCQLAVLTSWSNGCECGSTQQIMSDYQLTSQPRMARYLAGVIAHGVSRCAASAPRRPHQHTLFPSVDALSLPPAVLARGAFAVSRPTPPNRPLLPHGHARGGLGQLACVRALCWVT